MKRSLVIPLLYFSLVAIGGYTYLHFSSDKGTVEAEEYIENSRRNPYYNLESYETKFDRPLIERVVDAPEIVLKTVGALDGRDYKAYSPSSSELKLIQSYLELMPEYYKDVLKDTLIGIYLVEENFLGSGYAEMCLSKNNEIKTFMIINKNTLDYGLTEWASKKEQSCFKSDASSSIRVKLDLGGERKGFLAILIHEASHCVDYVERFTPYVDTLSKHVYKLKDQPILAEEFSSIWLDNKRVNSELVNFPLRSEITFYGMNDGPKLSLDQAKTIYQQLEKTPFISLYGSKMRVEDFAEAAMYYHLTQVLKLPYKIQVFENEQLIHEYEPMKNEANLKRLEFLKKFL